VGAEVLLSPHQFFVFTGRTRAYASDDLEERKTRFHAVRGLMPATAEDSGQAQDHSIVIKHKDRVIH
jgi:hypothetical protein